MTRLCLHVCAILTASLLLGGCGSEGPSPSVAKDVSHQVVQLARDFLMPPLAGDGSDAAQAEETTGTPAAARGGQTDRKRETRRDSDGKEFRSYYKYVDESGTVRFVESRSDIPRSARSVADQVDVEVSKRAPPAQARAPRFTRKAWQATLAAPTPRSASSDVVVYSAPWCGWCQRTFKWLDAKGVRYQNKDIEANERYKQELVQKTGRTSIPVVEIGGELIRGYNEAAMERLL